MRGRMRAVWGFLIGGLLRSGLTPKFKFDLRLDVIQQSVVEDRRAPKPDPVGQIGVELVRQPRLEDRGRGGIGWEARRFNVRPEGRKVRGHIGKVEGRHSTVHAAVFRIRSCSASTALTCSTGSGGRTITIASYACCMTSCRFIGGTASRPGRD